MDDEEEDTFVETLEEALDDQVVEVSSAEVEAELTVDPVTKPHDTGEWLAGFKAGVDAGRKDVFEIIRRVFGDSPMAIEIVRRVMAELAVPS